MALCDVAPEIAMPSKKAPTAADTSMADATPATSRAAPRMFTRNTSEFSLWTILETRCPWRSASVRTTVTTANAMPTVVSPPRKLAPARILVRTGRYTAMVRSSNTRMEITTRVSRLPSQPKSVITLAAIPDDEM
ncbi:hypothetical protein ABIB45_004551 [Arthrobacter sp. UYCo732]